MEALQRSFRDYFPIADAHKKWIRDPFTINMYEHDGLTSWEENIDK